MRRLFLIVLLWFWAGLCLAAQTQNVWSSAGDMGWGAGANWSLGHEPTANEWASFNDTSVVNCLVSDDVRCDAIVLAGSYSGDFDFGDGGNTIELGAAGETNTGLILDHSGAMDLGGSEFYITDGNLDYKDVTGAWTSGTSSIDLNGSCTITGRDTHKLYDLRNASASTTTVSNATVTSVGLEHKLEIEGTLTIADAANYVIAWGDCDLIIRSTATENGSGTLVCTNSTSGHGLVTLESGATLNVKFIMSRPLAGSILAAGTFGGNVLIQATTSNDKILQLSDGNYVFAGGLEFYASSTGDIVIDTKTNGTDSITVTDVTVDINSTGDVIVDSNGQLCNWVIAGDVLDEVPTDTDFVYNKGTGTITASGSSSRDWNWMDKTVEDIVVNKSAGTLTFSGGWIADSFILTDGSVDFGGQTVETTGDFTASPGATFATGGAGLDGADITVGGNFTVTGSDATNVDLTASAWTLDVTGGAHAYWVNVSNSDASAGSLIYANRSVNGGSNTNWIFLKKRRRVSMNRRGMWRPLMIQRGIY